MLKRPLVNVISSGQNEQARHLDTRHLVTTIKANTVSSVAVTAAAQIVIVLLNLASTVVLARLLSPRDFGLLAMVFAIITILRPFSEAGLSTATIQRDGISHAQVSNLFWTNVIMGVVISGCFAACAPLVAWFYREPRLMAVTQALSITFILTSLTVQHSAILRRQMRFSSVAVIQIVSTAAGVVVGVWMATRDYGYWCLVGMQLATPLVAVLLTWYACEWRPQLPSARTETRSLLTFGANLTVSGLLWSFAKASDGLLIGRLFGSDALGLYSRAAALLNRPLDQARAPLDAVFVPTLSRLQTQPERYRRTVLQIIAILNMAGLCIATILMTVAYPLTVVVLGKQWASAAPIFRAFTLYAAYVALIMPAGWVMSSQGRGKDYVVLSAFTSSTTVAAFILGMSFGPVGVATAFCVSCLVIQLPVTYSIAGRSGVISGKDFWVELFRHVPLAAIVWVATAAVTSVVSLTPPGVQLLTAGIAGVAAALLAICCHSTYRRSALEVVMFVKDLRQRRRRPAAVSVPAS